MTEGLSGSIVELIANGGSSLALVPALEWAKRSGLPFLKWIKAESAPAISFVAAILLAIGIHIATTATWDPVKHIWDVHFIFSGLNPISILGGILEIGKQWLAQHWTHKLYQQFDTQKSIAIALSKITETPTQSVVGANPATDTVKP